MKLEKGKNYQILESLGMMIIEGKYIGRASRGGCDRILAFESVNSKHSKFFSATWQIHSIHKASEEKPEVFLRSKYYSNSIEELGASPTEAYQLIEE